MDKRDVSWALAVVLLSCIAVKPYIGHCRELIELAVAPCLEWVSTLATIVEGVYPKYLECAGWYVGMKRLVAYQVITFNGWLDTSKGDVQQAISRFIPLESPEPGMWECAELAALSLSAILAGLTVLTALKFFCIYLYNKINWADVKAYSKVSILFTSAALCSITSPEAAVVMTVMYGFMRAQRAYNEYCPHPMPTLQNTMPDVRGIFVTDSLPIPPPRNVGGLEMAIPGVKTNKTTLAKTPFAFLICSNNWESVIGMGFRAEVDGNDVLVTVLHVHSGWEKCKDDGGYMHIFGKNGRARFKPTVVLVSKALDLIYYEYPKNIGAAGIVKGKHVTNRSDGTPVWVLSPPTENDGMIESSCATMQSYAPYHLMHWANTRPGSSGSPIFNKDGIIGVHRGSDGVRSNYGVFLFTRPKFSQEILETSPAVLKHYEVENFSGDDERVLARKEALKKAHADLWEKAQGNTWADVTDDDFDYGYGESSYASDGKQPYDPPGMNPVKRQPWFLDVIYNGECFVYPIGFAGIRSIGRPYDGKENSGPTQKSSPVLGITVGSTETGPSSSPFSATTQVQESAMGIQESERLLSVSPLSDLTLAIERMQQAMVQELRALKGPQPCVLSSTGGVCLTGQQQPSELPSSIKPPISKKAVKRAKKLGRKSSSGSLSATPAATALTNAAISSSGAA